MNLINPTEGALLVPFSSSAAFVCAYCSHIRFNWHVAPLYTEEEMSLHLSFTMKTLTITNMKKENTTIMRYSTNLLLFHLVRWTRIGFFFLSSLSHLLIFPSFSSFNSFSS